jgi:bifunctional non-homologous end joining protein LigD
MLAAPIDGIPEGEGYVIEAKLDGWRAIATVGPEGAVLTTRTDKVIETVPYINRALGKLAVGTILDGELVDGQLGVGIESWGETQGALTRTSAVQEAGSMLFVAFDVISSGGVDRRREPLTERRKQLVKLLGRRSKKLPLRVVEQEACSEEAHERHLQAGFEGSVVKKSTSRYRDGSRSGGWYKVKPQAECEATATGFYTATPGSKYEGWAVGGITFRLPNGYEGRAAGMRDGERAEMFRAQAGEVPDRWTGNVIELRHHGQTRDGALRHPQYQRVRDPLDKSTPDEGGSIMPTKTKVKVPAVSGRKPRNYGAMKDPKLLRSIAELDAGEGEAVEKCHDGDLAADLTRAQAAADSRGLTY